jgi:hypothetical protein
MEVKNVRISPRDVNRSITLQGVRLIFNEKLRDLKHWLLLAP